MDQEKIGKFISQCRKNKKITQLSLAEKLGVSDRAVSKWERGINMPDSSIMLELANILEISVNELLSGEKIEKEDYVKKAEEKLIKQQEINELYVKKLLYFEWIIGYISSITFLILIFTASFIEMSPLIRVLLIIAGLILFIIGIVNAIKIEQIAGYYECSKCRYKYVPSYKNVFLAMHTGRTRYMKCPKCHKRSWHKKVIK